MTQPLFLFLYRYTINKNTISIADLCKSYIANFLFRVRLNASQIYDIMFRIVLVMESKRPGLLAAIGLIRDGPCKAVAVVISNPQIG